MGMAIGARTAQAPQTAITNVGRIIMDAQIIADRVISMAAMATARVATEMECLPLGARFT